MNPNAEFDIIVYGATGFTGRLVAEHLAARYGVDGEVKWAMAGRSADKLAQVRDEIGAPANTPLIVADAADPASLRAMVARGKAILTTVGPYQLYGSDLVAACAAAGTDYLDLSGEPELRTAGGTRALPLNVCSDPAEPTSEEDAFAATTPHRSPNRGPATGYDCR